VLSIILSYWVYVNTQNLPEFSANGKTLTKGYESCTNEALGIKRSCGKLLLVLLPPRGRHS